MNQTQDRLTVLAKIRSIVGNNSSEGKVQETKIFCIQDGDLISAEFWQPEGYKHEDHVNPRAFIFYPTTKWEFRDDGELGHFSVGAILWRQGNKEREYCLFRRRAHPIGYYTIPAGHLEMGEDTQTAALREVYEETRLATLSVELLYQGEIQDECRRGSDYHFWYLYLCECIGEPRMSDEADVLGWFSSREIVNELKLTRPTGIFFGKHFNEMPKYVRQT
jgi:ADP-ribose pyrophosphatase YjhB (NUDIX family)